MKFLKLTLVGLILWGLVVVIGEFYLSITYPLTMTKKVNVTGLEMGFPILYLSYFTIIFLLNFLCRSTPPERVNK